MVAEKTGGDVFFIEQVEKYPAVYRATTDQVKEEQNSGARAYDFSGTTMLPLATHEGSGLGSGPSETSKAFLATLPRTISMSAYGEQEYYGRIEAISENGSRIPDFEDGDVTYYPAGPSFAVFYANSDRSDLAGLIRMGKLTLDLSVFKTLGESVEMRIKVAN